MRQGLVVVRAELEEVEMLGEMLGKVVRQGLVVVRAELEEAGMKKRCPR